MGALILPSRFNQQPQQGTLTSKALQVLFNAPAYGQQGNVALTTGAAWQRVATPFGVGLQGGHVVSPAGAFPTSAGAGNLQAACRTEHITFVILSNAVTEGLMSWGLTATDGAPECILQNNAGTLRAYDVAQAYFNLGPAVIGRRYVYSRVYNDFAPYTTSHYLNGVLIFSHANYKFPSTMKVWVGTGYPAQSTNAAILLYVGRSGVAETPSEVAAYAANPWQSFAAPRRLWAVASGAPADISGTFASTLGNAILAASGTLANVGAFASTLGNATMAATGAVASSPSGALAATLDGFTMAATGTINDTGVFASTLGGVTMAAAGTVAPNVTGTFTSTMGSVSMSASGFVGTPPVITGVILRRRQRPRVYQRTAT